MPPSSETEPFSAFTESVSMCATWWVKCGGVSPSLPSRLLPHGAARAARVAAADNVRRIMLATSKAGSGRCGLGIGVQSLG